MRWLFRILVVVFVALALAVVGLLMLPGDRIAQIASDQVQARTGRSLDIGGDVSVTLWPVLGVSTGPVRLQNADWAGDRPMLTAQGLSIAVGTSELLRGEIRVIGITADQPVLHLQSRADGRGNWEFGTDTPMSGVSEQVAQSAEAAATPVTLELLELRNATVSYAEEDGGQMLQLTNADLVLRWPDRDGPAELDATLRPAGADVRVAAHLAAPGDFLAGDVAPVTVRISTEGGEAAFEGRAEISGGATGRLALDSSNSAAMLAALGVSGPRVAANLATDLTYTPEGGLSLRDLDMELNGNRLTGAMDVALGDIPMLTAQLKADVLDLREMAAPSDSRGGGGNGGAATRAPDAPADGWSRQPIDASALGALNADVGLIAQEIRLPDLTLGAPRLRLRLDRSRAVLELAQVTVFDGTVTGQLVANNRSGLSVGGKLSATGVALKQALSAAAGIDNLNGSGSGMLEFLGVGQTEDAIMRSLSGRGNITVGKGFYTGFDLEELIRSGRGNGGSTVFDSLTASFVIDAGDLVNRDLALAVKNQQVRGEGRIGLGARDLDYALFPRITHNGRELRVPARVSGPWSSPRVSLDIKAALKQEYGDEIDRKTEELKQKAKEQLNQKIAEELDVQPGQEQSTEDILKQKLEDEARKGLLKLLGGD
ncbi:AsmA family protein [Rhodobacteraceae bacterium F11138]|nr:AsmA family protein [Rhodobacteraceae bacterium F11138]